MPGSPFPNTLTDVSELAAHYRAPNEVVAGKAIDHIDAGTAEFIRASPFVLIGSSAADGTADVSPKGGEPGFVRILDERSLAIPDLNGNNRIDTIRNVIENPNVGLLFLVPERGETMRLNGRAWVSVDDELRDSFTDTYRRPASIICVEVAEVFLHCAKCVRRSALWQPEKWGSASSVPSSGAIFAGHIGLDPSAAGAIDDELEASYISDLAADLPDM